MKYEINAELAQAILHYLGARPYVEVAHMIEGMKAMPQLSVVGEMPVEEQKA
jgi:hypothetical protein